MKLNESIHISLADHIHTAILNMQDGVAIPNPLILDLKRYYSEEYGVALQGIDIIENNLGYRLPEDEAGSRRLIEKVHYKNEDNQILESILQKYEKEYNCSKKVAQYIEKRYGYKTNNDEVLYLTVHLAHITNY